MSMVMLDHGGEKLSHHPEVADGVDLEDALDRLFGFLEDGAFSADAGVVYEDGRVVVVCADFGRDCADVGCGRYICAVEEDIRRC